MSEERNVMDALKDYMDSGSDPISAIQKVMLERAINELIEMTLKVTCTAAKVPDRIPECAKMLESAFDDRSHEVFEDVDDTKEILKRTVFLTRDIIHEHLGIEVKR